MMQSVNSIFKMSKYSDDFETQMKNIKCVGKETKKILEEGGKLAFEEYHKASSVERIKKKIMETY